MTTRPFPSRAAIGDQKTVWNPVRRIFEPVEHRRTKYGNVKTPCTSGHMHDSAIEARYCNELRYRFLAHDIKGFKTQVDYSINIDGQFICKHKVDFLVMLNDGKLEVHEVKGRTTKDWILKKKMFEARYPDIKYVVIKTVRNT